MLKFLSVCSQSTSNFPWAVYRCDRIKPGQTPQNEVEVERFPVLDDAYEAACAMRRSDPSHSFTVGEAA